MSTAAASRALPLLAILALAAALFIPGLTRALPESWDQDEITPTDVLRSLHRGGPGAAWPQRYPPFHYYVLAGPVQLVRSWIPPRPQTSFHTAVFLAIRSVSLLMALGIVLFAYLAGRELHDRRAGLFAAAAAALIYPLTYYAKLGNLDVPYTFWFAASLWFYLRLLRGQRLGDYVLFAVTAMLSICTKDQAYALYVLSPIPILVALARRRRLEAPWERRFGFLTDRRLVLPALLGIVLFLLIHEILAGGEAFRNHLRVMTGPDTAASRQFPATPRGHARMLVNAVHQFEFSLGLPVLVTALAGVVLALGDARRRFLALATLLLAASYYLFFIAVIGYHWDRYFLPIHVLLSLFTGLALAELTRTQHVRPALGGALAACVLGYAALRAVNLDLLLVNDSRFAIEQWIHAHTTRTGTRAVALGHPTNRQLPRLKEAVPWRHAEVSDGASLRDMGAKYVVINLTDTLFAGQPESARQILRRFDQGELDYRRSFVWRYPPPLTFVESRLRCWVDVHSSLCLINPAIGVYEWRPTTRLGAYLDRGHDDPAPLLAAAARERNEARYALAADLDAEAVCLAPENAQAWFWLGADSAAAGRSDAAEWALAGAVALAPDWADARLDLARLLARAGRTDEARREAESACAANPGSAPVWRAVADLESRAGRRAAAAAATARAAALAGDGGGGAPASPSAPLETWVHLPPPPPSPSPVTLPALGIAPAALVAGFGPEEREGEARFRWTAACALAEIEPPLRDGDSIILDYACGPVATTVSLRVGGSLAASEPCSDWERRRLRARVRPSGWFVPIEVEVEPSFVPARDLDGASSDNRELGVRVYGIGRLEE